MSQANLEVIRGVYEAWLAGNVDVAFEALDPDIELNPDPEVTWVGIGEVYRGHAGIRKYMGAVYEAFKDYRPEVEQHIGVGDQVLTLAIEHGQGRESGAEVQANKTAHVWTLLAGKAVRLDLYLNRASALKAVGLPEHD
jgi:ketosteroid isomerase-like protein